MEEKGVGEGEGSITIAEEKILSQRSLTLGFPLKRVITVSVYLQGKGRQGNRTKNIIISPKDRGIRTHTYYTAAQHLKEVSETGKQLVCAL